MDVYEAQKELQKYLSRLNASQKPTDWCLSFIMSNRDISSDLLACITTTMGKERLNTRLNIAFFIKDLCDAGWGRLPLKDWLQKDFVKIVDRAVPTRMGSIALVNVEPMRRVVDLLKPYLSGEVTADAVALLDSKESDPPVNAGEPMSRDEILRRMEDDRERTKKIKESKWQILKNDSEFDMLWNSLGGLNELDKSQMKYQNKIASVSRIES